MPFNLATVLLAAAPAAVMAATSTGQMIVVPSTQLSPVDPADRIGCLSAAGKLTLDDCATFTLDDATGYMTSEDGTRSCTFNDDSQPHNEDSEYADLQPAYVCAEDLGGATITSWYFISGVDGICQSDTNCYMDVPITGSPAAGEEVNYFEFLWGGSQTDVPEGHTRVATLFM